MSTPHNSYWRCRLSGFDGLGRSSQPFATPAGSLPHLGCLSVRWSRTCRHDFEALVSNYPGDALRGDADRRDRVFGSLRRCCFEAAAAACCQVPCRSSGVMAADDDSCRDSCVNIGQVTPGHWRLKDHLVSEQTIEFGFDYLVALADCFFKLLAVEDLDVTADITDRAGILQPTGSHGHAFAASSRFSAFSFGRAITVTSKFSTLRSLRRFRS